MTYSMLILAWSAVCLPGAQIVAAQTTKPQELSPSSAPRVRFEAIPEPDELAPPTVEGPGIAAIEFRGARRITQAALRAVIATRVGDVYDLKALRRDSRALYNTGRFSNVAWETELGSAGVMVRFVFVERPLIESIACEGTGTVTILEMLDRLRERKLRLAVDTLYNDDELDLAAAAVQELVAERERRYITVTPVVESIWPHSTVRITFKVEGRARP